MRLYNYFTIGDLDAYGQPQTPTLESTPVGQIKMAINITSQSVQDNINYNDANYIGLTLAEVDETYFVKYEEELLKVLYINPKGRFKQVFLQKV